MKDSRVCALLQEEKDTHGIKLEVTFYPFILEEARVFSRVGANKSFAGMVLTVLSTGTPTESSLG